MRKHLTHLTFGVFIFFAALFAMPALPAVTQTPVEVEAAVEPRADVIYWRFRRLSDGTIQKRRWNETRGCWMDPDWIDVT